MVDFAAKARENTNIIEFSACLGIASDVVGGELDPHLRIRMRELGLLAFVVVVHGCTFAIPERFTVARSTVSLVFLLIALFYASAITVVLL